MAYYKLSYKNMQNDNQKSIAGAILIVGVLIAGAILLKDGKPPAGDAPISKQIGLNAKSFNTCLTSGKFKNKIQTDIDDGVNAGVNGTPSSFILKDGVVVGTIAGAQPFEKVMQQIGDVLQNKTSPQTAQIRAVSSSDHILGNTNAKIVIVEYSDLECPFCKVFHNTMH